MKKINSIPTLHGKQQLDIGKWFRFVDESGSFVEADFNDLPKKVERIKVHCDPMNPPVFSGKPYIYPGTGEMGILGTISEIGEHHFTVKTKGKLNVSQN